MIRCPNINLSDWKKLEAELGRDRAMLAFHRNGGDIPTIERARQLIDRPTSQDSEVARKVSAELAKDDDAFRFQVSDAMSVGGVLDEVVPGVQYLGRDTRPDERQESGADERKAFKTPEGKLFYVYEKRGRPAQVWIDVHNLSEGEGGSGIYAAVANYAHNVGAKFIGDPAGLSEAATVRRTSNMLSSALRFGTTEHLEPSESQLRGDLEKGIAPLDWSGTDAQKTASLIRTFLGTTYQQIPQLINFHYDFDRGQFTDRSGRPLGLDEALAGHTGNSSLARGARIGEATSRRAILLQSLVSGTGGETPELLGQLLRGNRASAPGQPLNRIFSPPAPQKKWDASLREKATALANKLIEHGFTTPDRFAGAMVKMLGPLADAKLLSRVWVLADNYDPDVEMPKWGAILKPLAAQQKPNDTVSTGEGHESPSVNPATGSVRPESQSGQPGNKSGEKPVGPANVENGLSDDVPAPRPSGSGGGIRKPASRPSGQGSDSGISAGNDAAGTTQSDGTGNDPARSEDGSGVAEPRPQPASVPGRSNYHLTDPRSIVGGGPKRRFDRNKLALETYENVTLENRDPRPDELDKLVAYTGWGSFGQELFNGSWERPQPKPGWEHESEWLRHQLGEHAWKSAQASILNAHYTDPPTVDAMWRMVQQLGFAGGRVLEPSIGIGNFYSLMPRALMAGSQLTGIELDTMTARIAKMLHPQANVQQKGYQDSQTADNFYDLVIGNWPFAKDGPADRRYNHLNLSLHDYFFAKALDQTRPGGFVIGITSSGTMDKKNPTARRYMAVRGKLIAAFRLPTGAFDDYAGTAVVTDILVLQKRDEKIEDLSQEEWMNSLKDPQDRDFFYNEYYQKHPENILGTIDFGHGTTFGRAGMIVKRGEDFKSVLETLQDRLPKDIFKKFDAGDQAIQHVGNTTTVKRQNALVEHEGDLWLVQGEQLAKLDDKVRWTKNLTPEKRMAQARSYVGVRDALETLLQGYRNPGVDLDAARKDLKKQYDAFVKAHGSTLKNEFLAKLSKAGEPMALDVRNLEHMVDGKPRPRDILTKDIMRRPAVSAKGSIEDAYALQRNNSVTLDLDEIAKLAKKPVEEVKRRLVELNQIFETPAGTWEARDTYISGQVRQKLREARDAAEQGMDMARNIAELEKAQPPDTAYFDIEVKMGANWIHKSDYAQFAAELLGIEGGVEIIKQATGWRVIIPDRAAHSEAARNTWGHPSLPANTIWGAAMNGTSVTVKYKDDQGTLHTDAAETEKANAKVEAIREELAQWVWRDPERTARLSAEYNELMNGAIAPKRDGSHLRLEGLALSMGDSEFDFRKHQKDAVWRGLQDGRGMFAHEVGTGKTFTMAGICFEGRRLGLMRKPIVFAHNANSEGVSADFRRAYPSGKVLYVDNLSPETRDASMRQIALDDWDAIVVPHSLIDRFSLKHDTMMDIARREIEALENEIRAEFEELGVDMAGVDLADEKDVAKRLGKKPGTHTAKDLVKQRNRIIRRILKKSQEATKADALYFEDMGIDTILVDEAHIFKKLSLATRKKIKGLNKDESGKGFALSMMADYLKRQNNGRGVFLFTGTPITNTLNEAYNMMRYVMDDAMAESGVHTFDDWFNQFADTSTEVEVTSGGTYEAVERLLAFINVPELARMAGRFFDVVQAKNMPEFKPRSSPEGLTDDPIGRPEKQVIPVVSPMSPHQEAHKRAIEERYKEYQKLSPKEKRLRQLTGGDVPILMEGEGAKSALDYRLVDRDAVDFEKSKLNEAAKNILQHFHEHPNATQMVFMERGGNDYVVQERVVRDGSGFAIKDADGNTMREKHVVRTYNLFRDLIEKLIAKGVRPDEIAVFANVKLDPMSERPDDVMRKVFRVSERTTKEDLAAMMRDGRIRVAIGGTQTMGTGVNAQTWMRAMHHIDAPWTPGEFEQRNGRGWRQGNKWNTVKEYRYFTEGSNDGKRWQTLLNKVRFITRFTEMLLNGGDGQRVLAGEGADTGEDGTVADFEQSFSFAQGDPRLLLRAALEKEVRKLESKRNTHGRAILDAQRGIDRAKNNAEGYTKDLAAYEGALEKYNKSKDDDFSISLNDKTYSERKDADEALKSLPMVARPRDLGKFRGFFLQLRPGVDNNAVAIYDDKVEFIASPTMASIEGTMRMLAHRIESVKQSIVRANKDVESLSSILGKPFSREADLQKKREALEQIQREITASPSPAPSWLRNGLPQGSLIYLREDGALKPYDVMAHRWDDNGYWVLVDKGGDMTPVRYSDALDEAGTRLLPDYEFVAPKQSTTETPPTDDQGEVIRSPSPEGSDSDALRRFYDALELDADEIGTLNDYAQSEEPGEQTVGDPALANPGTTPEARKLGNAIDEYRRRHVSQVQKNSETDRAARELVARDPDAVERATLEAMAEKRTVDDAVTRRAGQILADRLLREALVSNDTAKLERASGMLIAYRETGAEAARILQISKDPSLTPAERSAQFLTEIIMEPPLARQVEMEGAPSSVEKARTIARLQREIAEAKRENNGPAVRDKTREVDRLQKQVTKERQMAEAAKENLARVEKALAREGLTMEDVNGDRVKYRLKFGKAVADALGGGIKQRERTIDLIIRGFSTKQIANYTKYAPEHIDAVREELRTSDKVTELIADLLQRGVNVDEIVSANFAATDAISSPAPAAPKMSREEALEQARRIRDRLVPSKEQADSGRWKRVKRTQKGDNSPDAVLQRTINRLENPTNPKAKPSELQKLIAQHRRFRVSGFVQKAIDLGANPEVAKKADELIENARKPVVDVDLDAEYVPFDLNDRSQVYRVANLLAPQDTPYMNMVRELWYGSVLSGPTTGVVHFLDNIALPIANVLKYPIDRLLNMVIRDPHGPQAGEFKYILRGMADSLAETVPLALSAWSTETDTLDAKYLDSGHEDYDDRFQFGPAIPGLAGKIVRIPMRYLKMMDTAFRSVSALSTVRAVAYRLGKAKGLEGAALDDFINEQRATPGSHSWEIALRRARENVLQDESLLLEKVRQITLQTSEPQFRALAQRALKSAKDGDMQEARSIVRGIKARRRWNAIFQILIAPFPRIAANTVRFIYRNTPGLSTAAMAGRVAVAGAKAAAGKPFFDSYSKGDFRKHLLGQIVGITGALVLWNLIEGDEDDHEKGLIIIGSRERGKADEAKYREAVEQFGGSQMIAWGDGKGNFKPLFNYGRWYVAGGALTALVNQVRDYKQRHRTGSSAPSAGLEAMASELGRLGEETPGVRGLSNLITGLKDAAESHYAEDSEHTKKESLEKLTAIVRDPLTAIVPNLVKTWLKATDDYERDNRSNERPAWGLLPGMNDLFPGHDSPPKIDSTGRPVEKEGGTVRRMLYPVPDKVQPKEPTQAAVQSWNEQHPLQVKGQPEKSAYHVPVIAGASFNVKDDAGNAVPMTKEQQTAFQIRAGESFVERSLREWRDRKATAEDVKTLKKDRTEALKAAKKEIKDNGPEWARRFLEGRKIK